MYDVLSFIAACVGNGKQGLELNVVVLTKVQRLKLKFTKILNVDDGSMEEE